MAKKDKKKPTADDKQKAANRPITENRKARQAVQKRAVQEQNKLLAEEAQKRAEAIGSVLDSVEGADNAPPVAPTP